MNYTTLYSLTTDDIKALKAANTIVFQINETDGAFILCRKETHISDSSSQETRIPISGNIYAGWKATKAVYVATSALYHDELRSVISQLRKGDKLTINFNGDYHTSPIMKDHGLHGDSVTLSIMRKSGSFHYLIDVCITYDNAARIIH